MKIALNQTTTILFILSVCCAQFLSSSSIVDGSRISKNKVRKDTLDASESSAVTVEARKTVKPKSSPIKSATGTTKLAKQPTTSSSKSPKSSGKTSGTIVKTSKDANRGKSPATKDSKTLKQSSGLKKETSRPSILATTNSKASIKASTATKSKTSNVKKTAPKSQSGGKTQVILPPRGIKSRSTAAKAESVSKPEKAEATSGTKIVGGKKEKKNNKLGAGRGNKALLSR